MFLKKRDIKGITYWSIVESHRVNGQPRQRVIENLGTTENALSLLKDRPEYKEFYNKILLQDTRQLLVNNIYNMDCLEGLKLLEDNSVDCCVTSPPYWGLRDYGTANWVGGESGCDHQAPNEGGSSGNKGQYQQHPGRFTSDKCWKCGAVRVDKQIGLESTPEEYVAKLVEIFREVRRVLKPEGTLWLNLGDTYCSTAPGTKTNPVHIKGLKSENASARARFRPQNPEGMKPKDLVGIPWMVAFALRADGWYLRSDIIWNKPSCMPESVKDRPTKSHEYIFLLSKSAKYYYDYEAIMEPTVWDLDGEGTNKRKSRQREGLKSNHTSQKNGIRGPGNWQVKAVGMPGECENRGQSSVPVCDKRPLKNKRSVWNVSVQPFPEAHFATFPPKLIEPCILAGCPKGGIVIDPFMGSGTTGMVSNELQRNYYGFELNPKYIKIAETVRTKNVQLRIV